MDPLKCISDVIYSMAILEVTCMSNLIASTDYETLELIFIFVLLMDLKAYISTFLVLYFTWQKDQTVTNPKKSLDFRKFEKKIGDQCNY